MEAVVTTVMKNPPVYFALAYVGFDSVRALSNYVPEIQDTLRKHGYTKYNEQVQSRILVESEGEKTTPKIQLQEEKSWTFGHPDQKSNFLLTESSLSFQVTLYHGHTAFFDDMLKGLNVVSEIVGISTITEVSIRYFDAVLPTPGVALSKYLASDEPSELSLDSEALKHRVTNSYSVFTSTIEVADKPVYGKLMIGTNWFDSKVGLPPEVLPEGLKFEDRFYLEEPQKHLVVDFQHALEVESPCDSTLINSIFLQLHAAMKTAFGGVFSAFAMSEWQ